MATKFNLMVSFVLVGAPLLADTPLPPPGKVDAWSEHRGYFVESGPNGDTTVYRMPSRFGRFPVGTEACLFPKVVSSPLVMRHQPSAAELQVRRGAHRAVARWTADSSDANRRLGAKSKTLAPHRFALLLRPNQRIQ